jgi:hypothetical protein
MGHNAKLLFIVYFIAEKTCYFETLLYCTQLDCINIGYYVHRQRKYKRKVFLAGC